MWILYYIAEFRTFYKAFLLQDLWFYTSEARVIVRLLNTASIAIVCKYKVYDTVTTICLETINSVDNLSLYY
jgi:hypothetical protein